MNSIRSLAMSKQKQQETKEYEGYYDNYDNLDQLSPGKTSTAFYPSSPKKDEILIILNIQNSEIGECADYDSEFYNWEQSHQRAKEIAYDRIEELLGKHYESKFTVYFDICGRMDDYEATITLIPNK